MTSEEMIAAANARLAGLDLEMYTDCLDGDNYVVGINRIGGKGTNPVGHADELEPVARRLAEELSLDDGRDWLAAVNDVMLWNGNGTELDDSCNDDSPDSCEDGEPLTRDEFDARKVKEEKLRPWERAFGWAKDYGEYIAMFRTEGVTVQVYV